jgi:hypothetical protein
LLLLLFAFFCSRFSAEEEEEEEENEAHLMNWKSVLPLLFFVLISLLKVINDCDRDCD